MRLRLPATSANLGPGFDCLGLAMSLFLTLEAEQSGKLTISASGRNSDVTGDVEDSLIVSTYRDVLRQRGVAGPELAIRLENEIPLGMGCGSSAAALLAGVHLANHFGVLGWTAHEAMTEACVREGHPDNVAACALGGLTVSTQMGGEIWAATLGRELPWGLMLALPSLSLSTAKARAVLPGSYSRGDAVANIQRSSLLVAACALGRPELLRVAMEDRIHQPYRTECCPLLPRLMPLAGKVEGIYGAALSGAGPSVLLVVEPEANVEPIEAAVREAAGDPGLEIVRTSIAGGVEMTI